MAAPLPKRPGARVVVHSDVTHQTWGRGVLVRPGSIRTEVRYDGEEQVRLIPNGLLYREADEPRFCDGHILLPVYIGNGPDTRLAPHTCRHRLDAKGRCPRAATHVSTTTQED